MLPFSNQFQSILNATTDTDDLKNELCPQNTIDDFLTEYYSTVGLIC
jgi:hypothetical protein